MITGINAWTSMGSRVAFEGTVQPKGLRYPAPTKEGLWLEKFGSQKLKLAVSSEKLAVGGGSSAPNYCIDDSAWEIISVALGANGTSGCLSVGGGNSETDVDLFSVLRNGTTNHLVSRSFEGGAETGIPMAADGMVSSLFGDGHFLGYLEVSDDALSLIRITPTGTAQYVADLTGLSPSDGIVSGDISVDSGNLVVREPRGGNLHVFTTAGEAVATYPADPAGSYGSIAIRKNRIVVLTADGQIAVYTLTGALVHSYQAHGAKEGSNPIATFYGYAVYLGAKNKSVHVLRLSTGKDRVIARPVGGVWGGGLSLQEPGLVVLRWADLNTVFVPMKKIRAKLG